MPYPYNSIPRYAYTCARCLSRGSRAFSNLRNISAPQPPPSSGYAELTKRAIISVSGDDGPKFLQGLSTNNVDPEREEGWYSAFLNAQGRVLWDAFIYPYTNGGEGKSYLIEIDSNQIESFVQHLKRHKLRSRVVIRPVQDEWRVWFAWQDPDANHPSEPSDPHYVNSLPSQAFTRFEALVETPESSYTIRRYLHGISEGQKEILRETALPLESNIDHMNGIDFRKGCYVGQELTIRTQHTGVVRKRILPVQMYTSNPPTRLTYDATDPAAPLHADIKAEGGKRPTGKLLSWVGNIGLALCRLENMTDLRVSAEGGTWKEGVEFNVATPDDGQRVKVKAFVPTWLREKEKMKNERRARKDEG